MHTNSKQMRHKGQRNTVRRKRERETNQYIMCANRGNQRPTSTNEYKQIQIDTHIYKQIQPNTNKQMKTSIYTSTGKYNTKTTQNKQIQTNELLKQPHIACIKRQESHKFI